MQPKWKQHLDRKGWTVLPRIIDEATTAAYRESYWSYLAGESQRGDYLNELAKARGVAHADFVWQARQERAILNVYEQICGTADLLSSFEAPFFVAGLPHTHKPRHCSRVTQGTAPEAKSFTMGTLLLTPADASHGAFVAWEKSHRLGRAFLVRFPSLLSRAKGTIRLLGEHEQWLLDNGCKPVTLHAPAGSLLLIDSRTAFYATRPRDPQLYSMYIRLSYAPRHQATRKKLAKKTRAFKQRKTTNPWPLSTQVVSADHTVLRGSASTVLKRTLREETEQIKRMAGHS